MIYFKAHNLGKIQNIGCNTSLIPLW